MRSIISIACLMLLFPCVISAARLQLEVPPGSSEIYLLSPGSAPVLKHLQGQMDLALGQLATRYQIDLLSAQRDRAQETVQQKQQAYTAMLASLREQYLGSISLSVLSTETEISPSSSALGDVAFFYVVKNNSDRIITDITYKPKIGGVTLPTTSSLVLEFIHPETLKSGLAPGETLSNQGHEPEDFSFFIGELSREEISQIKSEINGGFALEIMDMHFAQRKGYKDQTRVLGFEEAFTAQLQPLQRSITEAQARQKADSAAYEKAYRDYSQDRDTQLSTFRNSLEDLKQSSVRYQARLDDKNRCMFEDIAAGTYIVYARSVQGQALFTEITVHDKRQKLMLTTMVKDPFTP